MKNYLTVCGSELNSMVILWAAGFICHLSKFNIAVCLIKSNKEESRVRKKGKSEADRRLCFWNCPSLTLLALFKKKDDQKTESATSFESCQASALWWLAFVQFKQQSVLCTIRTLIIPHLSNLQLWKVLGCRSTCKVAAVEADTLYSLVS